MFGVLVARHEADLRGRVDRRLRKQLRSRLEVDDVVEKAFLRAWQAIGRFR